MRILVIGGTVFVGWHLVDHACAAGHEVTIFHRGRHPFDRVQGVEELLGDRDGAMDALGDRTWDVVIDARGYVPRIVRRSAERLKNSIGQYVFVSTRGVYEWWPTDGQPRPIPEP